MNLVKLSAALVFTIILSACASKASYDYDTTYNFSQLQSFTVNSSSRGDVLMDNRVSAIITDNLTAKGFNQASNNNAADFRVDYLLTNGYRDASNKPSVSLGALTGGSHISTGLGLSIPVGKDNIVRPLKISIYDQTGRLIWQGEDSYKTKDGASPEKSTEAVTQTTNKILSNFPPTK